MSSTQPLSPDEIARYARHIVLRHVGGPGQAKLKSATVAVVGAGGLGSPVIQYLGAAGVGTLRLIDDDVVSLSNLQRQVVHSTPDVGRPKVASAADAVTRLNPHVRVEQIATRLTVENARDVLAGATIIADCSDNFDARYAITDAGFALQIPVVTAAVTEFDGSITTLRPFETAADGTPNPTYRCLYPEVPPADMVPTCSETGVMGALLGIVGAMQALEVIREIVGFGEGLTGRLLLIDAQGGRFETMHYGWDAANPLSGTATGR